MKISEVIQLRNVKVGQVMQDKLGNSWVSQTASVSEVISLISQNTNSALAVLGANNSVVGIVTEKDIITALHENGVHVLKQDISSIMTKDPKIADVNATCEQVLITMIDKNFRNMPITDDGAFIGVVQTLEVAEGKISELFLENTKLKKLLSQFMDPKNVFTPEDEVSQIRALLSEDDVPCIIVEEKSKIKAIISEQDIVKLISGSDIDRSKIKIK